MATLDYFRNEDVSRLIHWQGNLDCAHRALEYLVHEVGGLDNLPEGLGCSLPIVIEKVRQLIDSCPFPPDTDDLNHEN